MGFKKERLGPRLIEAARSGKRYQDAHVFLGGTGAVGGTALLQMLSLYEEMFAIEPPRPDDVPVLVATGTTSDEIQAFTRRLFRFVESRHGTDATPRRIRRGYLTHSGVFVALDRFLVTAVPRLSGIGQTRPGDRRALAEEFLTASGTSIRDDAETVLSALSSAVSSARPFSSFLESYREENLERLGIDRLRSVTIGIPIPSLIAYHQGDLNLLAEHVKGLAPEHLERLKELFILAIRDDLVEVQERLTDTVVIAHTTGVGGMFDEDEKGQPAIRLGFSHAALDRRLADKARFAERLTELYSAAGLKILVTAAAIGIDEVRVREAVPLHREIRAKVFDAPDEVFPRSKASQPSDSRASRAAGKPMPARQTLHVFPPLTVPLDDPPGGPVTFDRGDELIPGYSIRSGENGFFTVADADSLYRTMRVASASELGLMLATVGLLGDDQRRPWFPGNVCYYDETDNARQVLDFLAQPALRQMQLSGLEPMSLQDLGSAKHQAELHTLGMLILLHRLRTLDVDAIDPYADLTRFDARSFFIDHSRRLTFEDLAAWEFEPIAAEVQRLAAAETPDDLLPLTAPRQYDLFPRRRQAVLNLLAEALRSAWTVTSLGSPILYERDGQSFLRAGFYVAPLDLLVAQRDAVHRWFRETHRDSGNPCSFEDFRDYHVAVGGFVDLRPHAIVCSAKSDRSDLTGFVSRFRDEEKLRAHLATLEPYSFFSTSGLLAVLFRLRTLYGLLREAMIELGSLHEWRWHMPRDAGGHILVVPGIVESLRMASEGLEKTTGTERLSGIWGYERREIADRRDSIPGAMRPGLSG
jgi:hypothetical protein